MIISTDLRESKVKYKLPYGRCTGPLLRAATRPPAEVTTNKNIKCFPLRAVKHSKERGGLDRSVSDNQSSSVTLNKLAIKPESHTVISSISHESYSD